MDVSNVSNRQYAFVRDYSAEVNKQENDKDINFFDDEWSGEIFRKMEFDSLADWLQDKDKVCTDGEDDGTLSIGEGLKAFGKGFLGGLIKMAINHPLATAVAIGLGAAAVALTGGAILPVLGAIGLTLGAGTTAYGVYGYATADNDGDAKMALETAGTGLMTTILSVMSAGSVLEKAAEAGVKSAEVSSEANVFTKSVQMFKAVPEALKVSKNNFMDISGLSVVSETAASSEVAVGTRTFTEEEMYQSVVNGEFESLADKPNYTVKAILQKFAKENGLVFKDNEGSFVLEDNSGHVIREVHKGFWDGQWYDHLHAYNDKGNMTNRFVLNNQGKWQSTVEFMYDDAGNKVMSYGYGGKAGTNIVVQEAGSYSRTEMTLDEFVDKFGFVPKYYNEINP